MEKIPKKRERMKIVWPNFHVHMQTPPPIVGVVKWVKSGNCCFDDDKLEFVSKMWGKGVEEHENSDDVSGVCFSVPITWKLIFICYSFFRGNFWVLRFGSTSVNFLLFTIYGVNIFHLARVCWVNFWVRTEASVRSSCVNKVTKSAKKPEEFSAVICWFIWTLNQAEIWWIVNSRAQLGSGLRNLRLSGFWCDFIASLPQHDVVSATMFTLKQLCW